MLRILARRRALAIAGGVIGISALFACSSILGLTDYHEVSDGGPSSDAGASCDVDLHKICYPCTPTTNEQFLNSCSGADCVPFDDKRVTKILPDGGLPPAPPGGDGSI